MNEHRRQILQMLAEGKINADEAERLISATEESSTTKAMPPESSAGTKGRAKYLRVQVDAEDGSGNSGKGNGRHDGPTKVNVRVPMQLLRAGVRLASLIPVQALNRANEAIHKQGIPFDLSQIKPENLEELIDHLSDLSVDVDQNDTGSKVKVKVFCE